MKNSRNRILTTTLSAALLMGSSLAMAGKPGDNHPRGEHKRANMAEACEQFNAGKMSDRHQAHMAKMEERHQAMADRLKLSDEQRRTWNEIQQERKSKAAEKSAKWQKKMEKRCEKRANKD